VHIFVHFTYTYVSNYYRITMFTHTYITYILIMKMEKLTPKL